MPVSGAVKDYRGWLSSIRDGKLMDENQYMDMCEKLKEILMESPNVELVKAPVKCCGDLHG